MYRNPMAKPRVSAVEFNAEWVREMRTRLGWSTTTTATRARGKAREFGDAIKLSQQLVSKFENGRLKSVPRWLGYLQLAMADEIREKDLPEGRLWKLRLPTDLQKFFAEIYEARNKALFGVDGETLDEGELSDEDMDDVGLLQQLSPPNREAVRDLIRALINEAPSPSPDQSSAQTPKSQARATLHEPSRSFSGRSETKGEAA